MQAQRGADLVQILARSRGDLLDARSAEEHPAARGVLGVGHDGVGFRQVQELSVV
jgi:hypothetical protein